jgi:hypothetical protein
MLQWHTAGSWEHRAYWGANNIPWGSNGTASRRYMGALPPTGQWVRLSVPASAVGLEGTVLDGMAFSLFDGRATWDYSGKTAVPTPLAVTTTTLPNGTVGTAYSQTLVATGGTAPYVWNISSGSLPAGLALNTSTGVISGTPTTPGSSGFTVQVADNTSATATKPLTLNIAAAIPPGADVVWMDDAVPSGATPSGTLEGWSFISANPTPYSGSLAHQSALATGIHQHFFSGASSTLAVNTGDTLFAYVYLDPANPPTEVMLQWHTAGSWEHRAYWGANNIPWGSNGTVSRRYVGALPPTGQWVRLSVPANAVGLEGTVLDGMAFTLSDGRATWDYSGKTAVPTP